MRKIVNELIRKYMEYVPVILQLNSDELVNLSKMPEEDAKAFLNNKQEDINKMELKKDRCPITVYYS